MNIKRLLNWNILFLFIVIVSIIIFFKFLENKEKNLYLKNTTTNIDNIYKKIIQKTKEYNQILFFNHIISDKKLIKILKKDKKTSSEIDKIKDDLLILTNFFTRYNIDKISFYSKDFELLYNSKTDENSSILTNSYKKIFNNLQKNKKEIITILVTKTDASLKFFKAIFDESHIFQGIVEISMDLPKLSHRILIDEKISVDFIFKKTVFENNLDKYSPYLYNKDYLYKKSFFNNRDDINFNSEKIKEGIKNGKIFKSFGEMEDKVYLKYFVPIEKYLSKEQIGYIIFTKEIPEYSKIQDKYNILLLITIFFLFFTFILFEQYKKRTIYFHKLESKLDGILKSIDKYVILVETDLGATVTYCSQAFCDISGYSKNEIIGRPISIIRHPDISKKFFENMWKRISTGKTWEGEIKNLDKIGNSYWEKGVVYPIYSYDKKIIGYRAIKVNITDEKQLQKVNLLLKKELFFKLNEIKTIDQLKVDESKIKLMSQILDTFSNEWKKPISNISSSLLEFENRVNTARYTKNELKEFILIQKDEIKNLSINLNEFRKLFIQSDKNDKYNIYNVIKSSFDSFCKEDINFRFEGDKTIENYGVFYDLKKVISGIIINSIDAFKTKNIKNKEICIKLSENDGIALLKIFDNAGGIPKEVLPKIFDYNFSTKYHTKAEGLPLYLAKLIIKKSGGDIWVENINNGCCFFIELKIKDKRKKKREFI